MTASSWRRPHTKAVFWSALLIASGAASLLASGDLGLVPMLLLLAGGWCAGFSFVNLTMRMPRGGVAVHIAVSVAGGAILVFVTEYGSRLLEPLPETARGVLVALQLAGVPAIGWIWLALLGRVTDVVSSRQRKNAPVLQAPQWQRDERGDGAFVSFRAIEMGLDRLTWAIVAVVVIVGLLGVGVLIVLDEVIQHVGARLSIIVVGLVLGVPAHAGLIAMLRRRTLDCAVAFGNDEVRIAAGETTSVIRFCDLERLRWRSRSDYARVELRGAGVDLSLITGIAKPEQGRIAELPALPRRVFTRLERLGFVVDRSKRGGVVTIHRAVS